MIRLTDRWWPEHTTRTVRPEVGRLIALEHGVFEVLQLAYPDLADDDVEVWKSAGCPEVEKWHGRPLRLWLRLVGGVWLRDPKHLAADRECSLTYPASRIGPTFHVYPPSGRWPKCSCCGEPMPCRAELADRQVAAAAARLDDLASRMAGCCWACREPITSRQQAVTYDGDNLDLPGGPPVRFHLRRQCWGSATAYENRWIVADRARQRILTYPSCSGWLVVHHDGSSECRPSGSSSPAQDCRGHETHNHSSMAACYCADREPCPRGCSLVGHPGAHPAPRPLRRDQLALGGAS